MPTATIELRDFELSEVEAAVGPRAFDRGRAYVRRGRVLEVDWDPDGQTLTGSVVGQSALYDTRAFFVDGGDGTLEFADGECSCPVAYNCKHVAAIVIAAADSGTMERGSRLASHVTALAERPAWEQPLSALIGAPAQAVGNPLALELSLHTSGLAGGGALRLMARRLMRPGARGAWVNGSLTWSGLNSPYGHSGEHRPDHVASSASCTPSSARRGAGPATTTRSRCCASSASTRLSSRIGTGARRAARRRGRVRPPRARVQPVHRLPRQGPRPPRLRRHRLPVPRRRHAPAGARARALQGRATIRCS